MIAVLRGGSLDGRRLNITDAEHQAGIIETNDASTDDAPEVYRFAYEVDDAERPIYVLDGGTA